jgi:hypothetical protein
MWPANAGAARVPDAARALLIGTLLATIQASRDAKQECRRAPGAACTHAVCRHASDAATRRALVRPRFVCVSQPQRPKSPVPVQRAGFGRARAAATTAAIAFLQASKSAPASASSSNGICSVGRQARASAGQLRTSSHSHAAGANAPPPSARTASSPSHPAARPTARGTYGGG